MKSLIWRRHTQILAYADLFISGVRLLGSLVFGGWVGYETIRILVEIKNLLPPDDGLPGFIFLIWVIGGFMNLFAIHQVLSAMKLVNATKSDLYHVTALTLSNSWRKGNASFIMSIVLDVLIIRYFLVHLAFLALPAMQLSFRIVMNVFVRWFRKELGGFDDCEQLKI